MWDVGFKDPFFQPGCELFEDEIFMTSIRNPITDSKGHTFDKDSYVKWISSKGFNGTCPKGKEALVKDSPTVCNFAFQKVIEEVEARKIHYAKCSEAEKKAPYNGFRCQYSSKIMQFTVIDSHGHSFDLQSLKEWLNDPECPLKDQKMDQEKVDLWLKKKKRFCPLNPDHEMTFLAPNYILNQCIDSWSKAIPEKMQLEEKNGKSELEDDAERPGAIINGNNNLHKKDVKQDKDIEEENAKLRQQIQKERRKFSTIIKVSLGTLGAVAIFFKIVSDNKASEIILDY